MRIFISILILCGVFACGFLSTLVDRAAAGTFLQASSTQEQLAGDTNPRVVTLNLTDAANGLTNQNGVVTIAADGTYFVLAAAQVGGKAKGYVRMWMRVNGRDLDKSNTEQVIREPGSTAVLLCQDIAEFKKGDEVEMVYSGSAPGLGLVIRKPDGEPLVTSMIFSAFKLD
jgi:hypothetical protein